MFIQQILNKFDTYTSLPICSSIFDFQIGAIVNANIRISEAQKLRIQNYYGLIIAQKRSSFHRSIRIRRMFQKIGVEQIVPLQTLQMTQFETMRQYKFKRSKLYYLRARLRKSSMIGY